LALFLLLFNFALSRLVEIHTHKKITFLFRLEYLETTPGTTARGAARRRGFQSSFDQPFIRFKSFGTYCLG
jgi:hypothetical protein